MLAAPAAASRAIGAEAYATGHHVAFAGTPSLHTAAHEAAHVVQQRAGVHLKGGVGEAGDPYERNADDKSGDELIVNGQCNVRSCLEASPLPAGCKPTRKILETWRKTHGQKCYARVAAPPSPPAAARPDRRLSIASARDDPPEVS